MNFCAIKVVPYAVVMMLAVNELGIGGFLLLPTTQHTTRGWLVAGTIYHTIKSHTLIVVTISTR